MLVIGLTGSLGMGKSATARIFAEAGVPVHDADATVHRLYDSEAVAPVEAAFPGVAVDGRIDRARLGPLVVDDKEAMKKLEAIVHPLVRRDEERFLARAAAAGAKFAVLDIPLLFETGADQRVDFVVVVSAPSEVQRVRVLRRPGMTEDKFRAILAKQMPDAEKRKRADFIVDSSGGFDFARTQVRAILREAASRPPRRAVAPDDSRSSGQ
ncbi:MAG: dephospho-CoA kinase [Rhodoplanes sp.]|uniref:dephospho-CoA kinase n=1 Tax=Rhodoplanes sp. TaxID=1968906 RepID=UPI0017A1964B|nr:dephospho-CoA kinase [Rhodoplanes sp.]NVO13006.1 dephospho-CoA kinase [Rhodoplanes sp.]